MVRVYDLVMTHKLDADDFFIHCVQKHAAEAGLNFFLIEPLWVEAFHLESIAGHYPHQVSGGQRQRTALARALVNEPAALLLDEPFAALDRQLRHTLREELRELQAELKIPMLLITHDDDDVRSLADDMVFLAAGRVVAGDAGAP